MSATSFADLMKGYNNKVSTYNNSLNALKPILGGFEARVKQLNPSNLWDDPNTEQNEDQGALLRNELKSVYDQYANNFNIGQAPEAPQTLLSQSPDWAGYASSYSDLTNDFNNNKALHGKSNLADYGQFHWNQYGQFEDRKLPTTSVYGPDPSVGSIQALTPDTNTYDFLLNQYNSILSGLDSAYAQRGAAETEVKKKVNELDSGLRQIERNVPRLDIANLDGVIASQDAVYGIGDMWNNYALDNEVAGQLQKSGAFDTELDRYNRVITDLTGREATYNDQVAQGKNTEQTLYEYLDSVYPMINSAGLGQYDEMAALRNELNNKYSSARRSWGNLAIPYDASGADQEMMSAISYIDELLGRGNQEKARIAEAQSGFRDASYDLLDRAGTAGIYNLNEINALQSAMNRIRGNSSSFESPMAFDFSGIEEPLTQAEQAIQALKDQRSTELGKFSSGLEELFGSLNSIEAYDEAGIKSIGNRFQTQGSGLASFIGSDADAIRSQITGGMSQVTGKLEELGSARTSLEQKAQALEKKIKDGRFRNSSDLDSYFSDSESLADEIELYNAQQAMDEIDRIMTLLNGNKQRLEADAQAVQSRNSAAQQRTMDRLGTGGVTRFALLEPFMRTSRSNKRQFTPEEESVLTGGSSSFSSALGLGA
jgi:hypothetical protein